MENYFQIRSIPYVRTVDAYPAFERKMKKMVGIHQMPAVVLPRYDRCNENDSWSILPKLFKILFA